MYHADGSATVNDVPVAVEPGQNVRDAAYQVAVGLVVAAGANGPVSATSIETDGTKYPLTLYPLKAVAAANALANAAANADPAVSAGAAGGDGAVGVGAGLTSGIEGQLRRARHAWYRPTLSMSWLVAGACACVMLSVLATVLLHENDPSVVRLSVDTENDDGHTSAARAIGRTLASLPDVAVTTSNEPTAKATGGKHPAAARTASPHADASAHAAAVGDATNDGDGGNTPDNSSQPANAGPKHAPGPEPRSAPGNSEPAQVTNLAVALVGGDKTDLTVAYVVTVATSNTNPVTLTYTYAGSGGRTTVRRSVVLSGQTVYALADLFPAQPYCGSVVTMTASTSPAANNGTVTTATQPGC
jgi:hypothetical protein